MTGYTFPGFELNDNADTDKFKVDIGTLKYGERIFVLHFLLSQNAPSHATPSVASVAIDERVVWKYNPKTDTGAFSRMALVDDEPVVAYVSQYSGKVSNVVPFSRLGVEDVMPLGVKSTLRYKRRAAEYLGTDVILSPAEHAFVRVDTGEQKKVADLAAAREAEREARRKDREEARMKKRAEINGRPTVSVKVDGGRQMYGQPVLHEEMSVLEPLCFYVLVGSFDENGEPQDPQTAFKAIAEKGKGIIMANGGYDVVSFAEYQQKPVRPESKDVQVFEISGDVYEVPVYADKAAIDTLIEVGVASIEFAAYPAGNSKFFVFALKPSEDGTQCSKGELLAPYGVEQKAAAPETLVTEATKSERPRVTVKHTVSKSKGETAMSAALSRAGIETSAKVH